MTASLFEEKEWIGEFYVPDQLDKRFPGKLTYSPENGVILSFSISTDTELPDESKLVYGMLGAKGKCTLLGDFNLRQPGLGIIRRSGKIPFYCLVMGGFLKPDEVFTDIRFSLTTLEKFLFPKKTGNHKKFLGQPIKTRYGSIEICSTDSFKFVEDITAHIYSPNHKALDCLSESYRSAREKYPDSDFMLKEDTSCYIRMTLDSGLPMRELYQRIMEIAHLFALFFYRPTYPESITVVRHSDTPGDLAMEMKVYPSLGLNKETIELATKMPPPVSKPITVASIDLGTVLAQWLGEYEHFFMTIWFIQNETGSRTNQALYGNIMLCATQLEWISQLHKQPKDDRYEYPVSKWGCDLIKDGLQRIFCVSGSAAIGKKISDLRNEIAHANRKKEWLKKLENEDLDLVEQYLQLTIIGFVLDRIGVDKDIVDQYQQHFCPQPSP